LNKRYNHKLTLIAVHPHICISKFQIKKKKKKKRKEERKEKDTL